MKLIKSNIYESGEKLVCSVCGKHLIEEVNKSMVNIPIDEDGRIIAFRPCCKGECDDIISSQIKGECDGWKELSNFTNPYLFIKYLMAIMNNMNDKGAFANEQAFEDFKSFILEMYPYVSRDLSDAEKENAAIENAIPF